MSLLHVNWNPGARQLRHFAFICAGILAALAWSKESPTLGYAAAGIATLGWSLPRAMRPLYVTATVVTLPIGYVVSFAIMGVLFYGMFTPIALVFRAISRDALARRLDRSATTYWVRRKSWLDPERYFRQF
jgi:hypothetical protein